MMRTGQSFLESNASLIEYDFCHSKSQESTLGCLDRIVIMEASLNSSLIGQSFPIGPTLNREGGNFCLFSKNADSVELLLFDEVDDIEPKQVIALDPNVNRTYHYWHVFVPSLKGGQLYGYRVTGPNDPSHGHRFDPAKILLDPYAKAVAIPKQFSRGSFSIP